MAPPEYTTIARVKNWASITTATYDAEILLTVQAVSTLFDSIYGISFEAQLAQEWHDGSGSEDGILLYEVPSPDSLGTMIVKEDDVVLVNLQDFRADSYSGRDSRLLVRMIPEPFPALFSKGPNLAGFGAGRSNVYVEYTTRFETIPEDIERACLEETIRAWQGGNQTGALDGNRIGIAQRSAETGTTLTYTTDDLTPTTMRMLQAYRAQRPTF